MEAPVPASLDIDAVPPRSRGRRRGRAPKSRDAVIGAVRELLRERRIDELMVNEIVERAGISRPTFYAQFDTKYSVVAELIADVGDGIFEIWAPVFDGEGPIPEAEIRSVSAETIGLWRQEGSLFAATIEGWHADEEIHDIWSEVLNAFISRLTARISRAGRTDRAVDDAPELIAGLLVSMFERALYMAVSAPESVYGRSDEELAAMLAHVWSKALA